MRIGFIGLGNIGFPIAANLLKAGHVMTVHDLDRARAAQLETDGAKWADSPAEVASHCDTVITSLPGPPEVKQVFEGGLAPALNRGQTWIEMSTTDVGQLRAFATTLESRGIHVLESPVTGGVTNAYAGQITIFVGGDANVLEAHRNLLQAVASKVIHLGALGNATVAKLITNMLAFVHAAGLAEGLLLGKQAGVAVGPLLEAIQSSYAGSFVADTDGPRALTGTYQSGFSLDLALKDMHLTQSVANAFNVPIPFGALGEASLRRTKARYGGDADVLTMMKLMAEDCGVELDEAE